MTVVHDPTGLPPDWPNVAVVLVNQEREVAEERTTTSPYYLSSQANKAAEFAGWIRGHRERAALGPRYGLTRGSELDPAGACWGQPGDDPTSCCLAAEAGTRQGERSHEAAKDGLGRELPTTDPASHRYM
jgi:hypothetical protein